MSESDTNDTLKRLYDASVSFKNDLASLRGNIKLLNKKTKAMTGKCSDFQGELDSLFELNKQLVEERKCEGTNTTAVRLDLNQKHKQMKQMQDSLVNMISVQPMLSQEEKH